MEAGDRGSPVGTAVADIEHVGSGSRRLSGHHGCQQLSLTVGVHLLTRFTATTVAQRRRILGRFHRAHVNL